MHCVASQAVRLSGKPSLVIAEMPANGGLLRIGRRSPRSGISHFWPGTADSLRPIFEIFPFLGDRDRRPGSICTAWSLWQSSSGTSQLISHNRGDPEHCGTAAVEEDIRQKISFALYSREPARLHACCTLLPSYRRPICRRKIQIWAQAFNPGRRLHYTKDPIDYRSMELDCSSGERRPNWVQLSFNRRPNGDKNAKASFEHFPRASHCRFDDSNGNSSAA